MKIDKTNLTPDEQLYLKAKDAYYNGLSFLTDPEFDALENKLRELDSFVVDIVGAKSKKRKVIQHQTFMGSLAKIKFSPNYVPYQEFQDKFISKFNKYEILFTPEYNITFEPKLDGNAINIIYENEILKSVSSRGDGKEGQDYTNILSSKFPKRIKGFSGEIRGEAVIDTYLFEQTYKNNGSNGKKYSNARNFVAGSLNSGQNIQDIDIICFEIVGFTGDSHKQLNNWGFDTHDFIRTYHMYYFNELNFKKVYEDFVEYRETCNYQLDGYVVKANEKLRKEIGGNDHHPYWALAIKFETKEVSTKIIDIEWNIKKQGVLAPIAILEHVNLLDSMIGKASLYNASWLMNSKAYPGAVIELIRSGDIIPVITNVSKPSDILYELPKTYQNKNVIFDGVNLIVEGYEELNDYKSVILSNAVIALGIKEVGPATCDKLVQAGYTNIIELMQENPEGLRMNLLNSGLYKDNKELQNLIENLFSINEIELWQVIYSMQFRNLGKTISKQLANWHAGIQYDFKGLEKEVIEKYINNDYKKTEEFIKILKNQNINIKYPEKMKQGLIFVELTGSPTTHDTKAEFIREIEKLGAKHTSLTKDTHYLVTDSLVSTSGKMKKAKSYNIPIMTYDEFLEFLKNKK